MKVNNKMKSPIPQDPRGVRKVVDEAEDGTKAIPVVFVQKSADGGFTYDNKPQDGATIENIMKSPIEDEQGGKAEVVDEDIHGIKAIPLVPVTKNENGEFEYVELDTGDTTTIPDGGVTTDKLADGAVTTEKIADGAVTSEKLAQEVSDLITAQGQSAEWAQVSGKPDEYKPEDHTHPIAQVDGLQAGLDQRVSKAGDTMTGPIVFADPNNRSKLILTKYPDGTGHSNAPTTFDLNSVYLHLGGTEYAPNSYRLLGFGFRHHEDTSHAAAVVGYQEIDTNGNDMGDIIAATRNSTTDVAPTIHLRVKHDGQVELEQENYIPASDKAIPNKKYVDGLVPSKLSAVEPIADPSAATAEDIANKLNELLAALKS